MTPSIAFQSHVAQSQRRFLEALVFFNACQVRVMDCIAEAVERFGTPEIVEEAGRLRVRVRGRDDVQCLFAVESDSGRPVGVAVYIRPDLENITVLHLSIASEHATGGIKAGEQLLLRLLRELRRSTRKVKGVRRVELYYLTGRSQGSRARTAAKRTA
ncbi:MAG: hypothetical protein ABW034_20420 [Steroidobacteraceae bacterium]